MPDVEVHQKHPQLHQFAYHEVSPSTLHKYLLALVLVNSLIILRYHLAVRVPALHIADANGPR